MARKFLNIDCTLVILEKTYPNQQCYITNLDKSFSH